MKLRRSLAMRFAAALLAAPAALSPILATPAQAFIVFDPSNYSQNVLTAARSLTFRAAVSSGGLDALAEHPKPSRLTRGRLA